MATARECRIIGVTVNQDGSGEAVVPGAPDENGTGVSARRWEHFPHDADIGVRGFGDTFAEALAAVAEAVMAVMVDPDDVRPETRVEIELTGADAEDLLYAWINALVFEMATRRMLFRRFAVTVDGPTVHAEAWGERVSPRRHEPAVEVKGATMTALRVRREDGRWIAECVVDV